MLLVPYMKKQFTIRNTRIYVEGSKILKSGLKIYCVGLIFSCPEGLAGGWLMRALDGD